MDIYFETFAKAVDEKIIPYTQSTRVLSKTEARALSTGIKTYCDVVYFLFHGDELIYIGLTGHLPSRVTQHHYNRRIKFDSVMVMILDRFGIDVWQPRSIESKCISLFRPRLNKQDNPDYKNINGKQVYLPELESILNQTQNDNN